MGEVRDAKIKFAVDGESFEFSTATELMIDRDDLDNELSKQAAIFAWFGVLRERARAEREIIGAEIEDLEGVVEDEIRSKLDDKKMIDGKKMTEDAIKSKIAVDARLRLTNRKLLKAANSERFIDMFVSALAQRKDMLVALAKSRHLEMSAPSADDVDRIKRTLLGR